MEPEWPCSSEELTRRLGWRLGVEPAYSHALKTLVRPVLKELRCPREPGTHQSRRYLVSEAMAQEVSRRLGRRLRV
jgi:hypothetical protein